MIIVYTPAGGEPEHYDASGLKVSEASIVQRTIDQKWKQIQQGLQEDELDAMRGIVWVLKKRANPSLRFGEFDPGVDEMTTRMDAREVEAWVENSFAAVDEAEGLTAQAVKTILMDRLPDVAADPDHARRLIEARAEAPKAVPAPDADQTPPRTEQDGPSQHPTSSEPEASTSASSPTSSTSPQVESTA